MQMFITSATVTDQSATITPTTVTIRRGQVTRRASLRQG